VWTCRTADYGMRGFRLHAGLGCRGAAVRQERQPEKKGAGANASPCLITSEVGPRRASRRIKLLSRPLNGKATADSTAQGAA